MTDRDLIQAFQQLQENHNSLLVAFSALLEILGNKGLITEHELRQQMAKRGAWFDQLQALRRDQKRNSETESRD